VNETAALHCIAAKMLDGHRDCAAPNFEIRDIRNYFFKA
jgi:hypothetical protein